MIDYLGKRNLLLNRLVRSNKVTRLIHWRGFMLRGTKSNVMDHRRDMIRSWRWRKPNHEIKDKPIIQNHEIVEKSCHEMTLVPRTRVR